MAARGQTIKDDIVAKLLEIYGDNAAVIDKVLRIRGSEGGESIEIKITLTAAKDNVMDSFEKAAPASNPIAANKEIPITNDLSDRPSDEEMAQLDDYIKQLERMHMI